MKPIETEKATNRWDLPHAMVQLMGDGAVDGVCHCKRPTGDALHGPVILEQAAHRETIITEKGI